MSMRPDQAEDYVRKLTELHRKSGIISCSERYTVMRKTVGKGYKVVLLDNENEPISYHGYIGD